MKINDQLSAYFNLLKTVLGAALIKYPYLFSTTGLIPITLSSLISILFSFLGLLIYAELNELNNYSINLTSLSNNNALINLIIGLKCFFVFILYTKILNELIISYFIINEKILLLLILFLILPFIYQKSIKNTKGISLLGILSVIIMLLSSTIRLIDTKKHKLIPHNTNYKGIFDNLGLFVFGYTCHQNIFSVHSSMTDKKYFRVILVLVLLSAMMIYYYFGIINYLIFGINTNKNIIGSLPNDKLGLLIKVFYGLSLLFTIPLQSIPLKFYFLQIIEINNHLLAFIIFMTTFLLISYKIPLDFLFEIVGGVFSSVINFIMPSVFYLRIKNKKVVLAVSAVFLGMFGLFNVIFTVYTFYNKNK